MSLINDITTIRTVDRLRDWCTIHFDRFDGSDEKLIWYNALFEASCIIDAFTTKDLASALISGFGEFNSLESVQRTLDTFFEDEMPSDHCGEYLKYLATHVHADEKLGEMISLAIQQFEDQLNEE